LVGVAQAEPRYEVNCVFWDNSLPRLHTRIDILIGIVNLVFLGDLGIYLNKLYLVLGSQVDE